MKILITGSEGFIRGYRREYKKNFFYCEPLTVL